MTPREQARVSTARRMIASVIATLGTIRLALWIAKAIATAGTVDTALQMVGLHGPVDEFEAVFDATVSPILEAARIGWDAFMAALDAS